MSQKSEIIHYLSINKTMTQGDLSEALYGDRNHLPNLYASLMGLVNSGVVIRKGDHPAYYSLANNDEPVSYDQYRVTHAKTYANVSKTGNKSVETKGNVIILNKPFLGGWLDKQGNIGHEIIDFLLTDDNQYYVYNNPWGICPSNIWVEGTHGFNRDSKEQYIAKYTVLTSEEKVKKSGNELDILYVIELAEKLHRFHTGETELRRNQMAIKKDIIRARNIKYNGKFLDEIYGDDDSLYLTFKGARIYKAEPPIRITGLQYDFRRNKGYLYSDQHESDYLKMFNIIEDSIKNRKLVEFTPRNVNPSTIGDLNANKTFLDLIALETDEQVFTNMLHSILGQGELLKHFCMKFKGNKAFNSAENYSVYRETKVVDGRMDVCAESSSQRVIIENKVYSGLNGVRPADNTTQLSIYYRWGIDGKAEEPLCFVVAPEFRINEIRREIAEKDATMLSIYQIKTYGDIANFIEEEYSNDNIPANYAYYDLVPQIINAFRNLSYSTKEDLYAKMFLNATNK